MEIEKYKEIKIFPMTEWGISVEDYRADISDVGITISTYDYTKGKKENIQYICIGFEEAKMVADAIYELI
jgi:hypothetical protein